MKKILKLMAILVVLIIGAGFIFVGYIVKFKPNIPVEELRIEYTPERIERGKYLAHHVSQCIDCHSTRDWQKFSAPIIPGTEGKGGEPFDRSQGFPGNYYASNLTPFHLKDWSDGEIFRALTAGVSKDGRPLFPVMPYPYYGKMDREDIYSIIAYLRTLPHLENNVPAAETNFPMSIIIHTIPAKPEFSTKPSPTDKINYGKYLTSASACIECHTPAKRGQIIEDLAFSGGRYFPIRGGVIASANITPDKETGIGNWTEEIFVERFKMFDQIAHSTNNQVKDGEFNTIMPWVKYGGMTRQDLGSIFAYLQTLKPVSNKVTKNVHAK